MRAGDQECGLRLFDLVRRVAARLRLVPSNLCQSRGRQRLQDPRVGRGARVLAADIVQGGGAPRPRPPAGGRSSGPNCCTWPCGRGRKGCARGCGVAAVGVRRPHRRRDGSALALRGSEEKTRAATTASRRAHGGRTGGPVGEGRGMPAALAARKGTTRGCRPRSAGGGAFSSFRRRRVCACRPRTRCRLQQAQPSLEGAACSRSRSRRRSLRKVHRRFQTRRRRSAGKQFTPLAATQARPPGTLCPRRKACRSRLQGDLRPE